MSKRCLNENLKWKIAELKKVKAEEKAEAATKTAAAATKTAATEAAAAEKMNEPKLDMKVPKNREKNFNKLKNNKISDLGENKIEIADIKCSLIVKKARDEITSNVSDCLP
ncbi:12486_t:CDS:2 [Dentiscutata erythropus]|uniref:12486_t:CDS:1 n=1 Tax=Dentiscutata erythropus TaxID=1348616 RepID=A0A9N8W827_9GLOM|nr:12486_t:CDS:2 [Dentiscutata erythropus]